MRISLHDDVAGDLREALAGTPHPHPQPRRGRPQLLLWSSGRVWAGARNQLLKVFFLEKVVCDILGVRMLLPITLRLYLELRPFKYLHVTIISFQEKPPSLTVHVSSCNFKRGQGFPGSICFLERRLPFFEFLGLHFSTLRPAHLALHLGRLDAGECHVFKNWGKR